jgi:hypothetical protein
MNKRQKNILVDFVTVIVITVVAVVAMLNFKDWVNRSEAMRAMEQLGQIVLKHRDTHGAVPSESFVDGIKQNLQGQARLGELRYRARWLDFESTPDEILAYSEKNYNFLLGDGYIVLRLDGSVEWMEKKQFESLLARQQSPEEIRILEN